MDWMDGWIEEMINGCHFATQLTNQATPVPRSWFLTRGSVPRPRPPCPHPGEPRASPASVSLPIRYTPALGGKLAGWLDGWLAGFTLPNRPLNLIDLPGRTVT